MPSSSFLHGHLFRFGLGLSAGVVYSASRMVFYERIGFFKGLDFFGLRILKRVR